MFAVGVTKRGVEASLGLHPSLGTRAARALSRQRTGNLKFSRRAPLRLAHGEAQIVLGGLEMGVLGTLEENQVLLVALKQGGRRPA